MSRKNTAVADDDVFVGDDAVEIDVFTCYRILHYDTVFNVGILPYLYAAEQDRVFDSSFDDASVSDQRVADYCAAVVRGGRGVTNLCEHGTGFNTEERATDLGIEKVHTATEVIIDASDGCEVAVEFINAAIVIVAVTDKYVFGEACVSVSYRIGDDLFEIFSADNENADVNVFKAVLDSGIVDDIGDLSLFVGVDDGDRAIAVVCDVAALDTEGDIRAGVDVLFHHCRKVKVANRIAIGKDNDFFFTVGDEIADAYESIKTGFVKEVTAVCKSSDIRRENFDTALTARKVPIFTGSDMIHERLVVIVGYKSDVVDAGVDHVGKCKVDKAVTAAERNGSHCALLCELVYAFFVDTRKDDTYCVHHITSLFAESSFNIFLSQITPSGTLTFSGTVKPPPTRVIPLEKAISLPTDAPLPTTVSESMIE